MSSKCKNPKSFKVVSRPKKGECQAYRCNKTPNGTGRFCRRHYHMLQKDNDPVAYTYHILRTNARTRGKVFEITMEEFRVWCDENNYIELKGRSAMKMSIDRKDPLKGYTIENMQMMRFCENSSKGATDDKCAHNDLPF